MTLPTKFRRLKLWIIIIPLISIALGNVCNQAVIVANHDKFPVMFNGLLGSGVAVGQLLPDDPIHCMMGPSTHLNFLADIFDFHDGLYSIGDGLLYAGLWLWKYAPAVWIFTLCSLVLKGKDEPLKPTTFDGTYTWTNLGPQSMGGPSCSLGAYAGTSPLRSDLQSLRSPNTQMRVC